MLLRIGVSDAVLPRAMLWATPFSNSMMTAQAAKQGRVAAEQHVALLTDKVEMLRTLGGRQQQSAKMRVQALMQVASELATDFGVPAQVLAHLFVLLTCSIT